MVHLINLSVSSQMAALLKMSYDTVNMGPNEIRLDMRDLDLDYVLFDSAVSQNPLFLLDRLLEQMG